VSASAAKASSRAVSPTTPRWKKSALIGARRADGHRRDLLIEYLHLLNDAYRYLHERHLVALAMEMNIPMAGGVRGGDLLSPLRGRQGR
jgi:NADH:ubiquinone oxidoreductase subunit E